MRKMSGIAPFLLLASCAVQQPAHEPPARPREEIAISIGGSSIDANVLSCVRQLPSRPYAPTTYLLHRSSGYGKPVQGYGATVRSYDGDLAITSAWRRTGFLQGCAFGEEYRHLKEQPIGFTECAAAQKAELELLVREDLDLARTAFQNAVK